MILLDVNVLVYAHREDTESHSEYRSWLEQHLDDDLKGCAVSELVLSGCLRILTHPKIFNPPTPLPEAVTYVGELHDHPNMTIISPGPVTGRSSVISAPVFRREAISSAMPTTPRWPLSPDVNGSLRTVASRVSKV